MATTSEILRGVHFFSLLDEHELKTLADRVDEQRAEAGEVLFHVGDVGAAMFVIREGRVDISLTKPNGERVVLERLQTGDVFGELSLLDGGARSADAHAITAVDLIVVDRDDLDELFRLKPTAALDLLSATGKRLRDTSRLLREVVAKDINEETEDRRSTIERVADWITDFSGSIPFFMLHVLFFAVWVALNVPPLRSQLFCGFDPFPFGLLTMVVSLEAILLSVLVMLSQNRQVARDRIRNDIEYQVNVSAEAKVASLVEKVDRLDIGIAERLDHMERHLANLAEKKSA